MRIIIDNSLDDVCIFYLKTGSGWIRKTVNNSGGEPLLAGFQSVLKKLKKELSDIDGIAVVVGKGRFTATRVAVTVANTLAYAFHIPVVALNRADTSEADRKFGKSRKGVYISAKYSGEAHIGNGKRAV